MCWHSNRIGNNLLCYFFNFLVLKIEQNLKLLSHHHSQGTQRVGGLLHGDKTTGLSSWRSSFGRLYEADSQQPVWQNVSCQYQEIYSISSLCKKCSFFRIESILKHFNTFIVTNEEDCLKALASPFLRDFQFLEDGSIVVQHFKEQVTMSRPNIIGISILELSKCLTYGYYYDVLRKAFGDRVRLAYTGFFSFILVVKKIKQYLISSLTDTDSFVVSLYTDSLDKELQAIKSTLDTSNYPTTSPLFTLERQKQLFSWKNESVSPILLFVALRSKCYAFLTEESLKDLIERTKLQKSSQLPLRLKDQGLRNKGVVSALNESLGVVPYLCSLLARSFISANFRKIESCGSIPHVKSVFKSCLSFLDNKSLQKSCYIHSVPYGLIGEDLLCSCMD